MAQPLGRDPASLQFKAAEAWVRAHPLPAGPQEDLVPSLLLQMVERVRACWDAQQGGVSLEKAVKNHDDFISAYLLTRGGELTEEQRDEASKLGMVDTVRAYLQSAPRDEFALSRLRYNACLSGHKELYSLLLEQGVSFINYEELEQVMNRGWTEELQTVVKNGEVTLTDQKRALYHAAELTTPDAFNILLDKFEVVDSELLMLMPDNWKAEREKVAELQKRQEGLEA